jgi:hypothetical protein
VRCGRDGDLTRHRRPPDLMARIRAWFTDAGFDETAFDFLDTTALTVGAGRLRLRHEPGYRPDRYARMSITFRTAIG